MDSLLTPEKIVRLAAEAGCETVGICDPNLHAAVPFYQAAKASGLRPLIGAELMVAGTKRCAYAQNQGGYANLFSYGWTEFDIDATTQLLTFTTYGINPYNAADVLADQGAIAGRNPTVISKFQVAPVPLPAAVWLLAPALGALVSRRRKV
jgi:hypothetical protein